jgi:hypothetical protein
MGTAYAATTVTVMAAVDTPDSRWIAPASASKARSRSPLW